MQLTLPAVWKWLSEAAGECGSAFDWGEVFPNAGFLRGSVLLGGAGPGEMCSLHRPHSPWKRVLCKQLCLPESSAC